MGRPDPTVRRRPGAGGRGGESKRGELRCRRGRGALLAAFLSVTGELPRSIELAQVGHTGASVSGDDWPRPFALPLPVGFVAHGERLALLAGGRERPARIEAWTRHADGSPHWVRVAAAPWPAGMRRAELRPLTGVAERTVDASPARAGRDDPTIAFDRELRVRCGASELRLDLLGMRLVEHGTVVTPRAAPPPLELGPDGLGREWQWRGQLGDEGGIAAVATVRVVAAAGTSVRAEVELALEAAREVVVEAWRLHGQVSGESLDCRRGTTAVRALRNGPRESLALRATDLPATGEKSDDDASGWNVRVGSGRSSLRLDWPDFGSARPAGATLQPSGRLELQLVARPLLLRAGQVVRRRLLLGSELRAVESAPRPWLVIAERDALALPEREAGVIDRWVRWLGARSAPAQRLDDRGCYPLADGDFANGEYDLGGSLLELGQAARDAAWLAVGAELARHTLDWDRTHEPGRTVPAGLFAQHGRDHASGRVEAGHQWIGGALGLARCSGDLAAFAAARTTVAALAGWRVTQPERFDGPERRLAWPLHAALDLDAALGEPSARAFAAELVAAFAARRHPEGFIDGDRRPVAGGRALWVNSWVSLGISVTALERAARRGHPAAAAAASALGGAVVAAAQLPGGGLAEVVTVDPDAGLSTRRGAPLRRGEAVLAAAGLRALLAAAGATARPEWAAGADALHEAAWTALAEPAAERAIDFAQALQALRLDRERVAAGQSRIEPSSLR
ncbi:MAG: hypothetical protein FJ293_12180 [Planctomycetes bacterium]|nr:hypothetical protein [Planctomycetota bacterium]